MTWADPIACLQIRSGHHGWGLESQGSGRVAAVLLVEAESTDVSMH